MYLITASAWLVKIKIENNTKKCFITHLLFHQNVDEILTYSIMHTIFRRHHEFNNASLRTRNRKISGSVVTSTGTSYLFVWKIYNAPCTSAHLIGR